jgi:hypothetical protein
LFSLGSFLKILLATFFHGESNVLILAKMAWATLWAFFSQTHLVTLKTAKLAVMPVLTQIRCIAPEAWSSGHRGSLSCRRS